MAAPEPQSFANHRKLVPGFHYLLATILLLNLIWAIVDLVHPGLNPIIGRSINLLLAIGLGLLLYYTREFPMAVQNRIIRLEERLRLERVCPDLKGKIGDFAPGQLIALRFASDAELPAL
ncbi:MAG TPA: DUF6526 family protein, partial [Thermoanaerobaculia bacterium]|nr:DUF6526 family protein [Thermoanaerobaculia bacterium]